METVETELKELILSRYKSLREFTISIGMPYSTLDTILKRGVDKANIGNIIKLCKALDIDVEALGEGEIIFKSKDESKEEIPIYAVAAHHDGGTWTEEELKAIEDFKEFIKSKRNK